MMIISNNEDISKRIKELIYKKGMSITQFANGAGIDQSNLSSILNGKRRIGTGLITKIVEAYNINPEWLTMGDGDVYNSQMLGENNADYSHSNEYREKYIQQLESENSLLKKTIEEQSQIIQGFLNGSIQKIK